MELNRKGSATTGVGVRNWQLAWLDISEKEGRKFLDQTQYAHAVQQFELLAEERDPTKAPTCDVEPIEDYFELRDKGGLLGKINLRVYFAMFPAEQTLVVLGCWNKRVEGKTPEYIKARMRNRKRFVARALLGKGQRK